MSHSSHHTPHQLCFILESLSTIEGTCTVYLRVPSPSEEDTIEWTKVLSIYAPLPSPQGCYYLLSLNDYRSMDQLEIRLDIDGKSYGASVHFNGSEKLRGRVLLFNEDDSSDVITATAAFLIRKLPLTPRENDEVGTQTLRAKTIDRSIQTNIDRCDVATDMTPRVTVEVVESNEDEKEERRQREILALVENTVKNRLLIGGNSIDRSKNLKDEVIDMRRSIRILGQQSIKKEDEGTSMTPPQSPSSSTTSSSSSSSSSDDSSNTSRSSSSDSSSSSSSYSSSTTTSSIQVLSPTSAYLHNLRQRIMAERRDSSNGHQ